MYNFIFAADRRLTFRPGQYLEWTLPHTAPDSRGNRRYFTIASSPNDSHVMLGVKFYKPASTFKRALAAMKPGDTLAVGQLAGDFVLPKNPHTKLAFIAGGIGITPFRSMVGHLLDCKEKRDIVLLYSNKTVGEIAYKNIFNHAQELGLKTVYAITDEAPLTQQNNSAFYYGAIDARLIAQTIPDYRGRC